MVEILSLSKARKSRDRADKKKVAEENRVRFGLSRAERESATKEGERTDRILDAHRLEPVSIGPNRQSAPGPGRNDPSADAIGSDATLGDATRDD